MNRLFGKITVLFACITLTTSCGTNTNKSKIESVNSHPREAQLVGNDRDDHGCIASAGYQWSELLKDCIRPFEKGTRLQAAEGEETLAAYLVFNNDSSKVELFLPKNNPHPILTRIKTLDGEIIWTEENEDKFSVRCIEKIWGIYYQEKLQYVNY